MDRWMDGWIDREIDREIFGRQEAPTSNEAEAAEAPDAAVEDAAEVNGAALGRPVRVQRACVGTVVHRAAHPGDVAVAHLGSRGRVAHARGDPRLSLDQGHAGGAVDETQQPVSQEEGQHRQQGSCGEVGSEPGDACAPGSKREVAQASARLALRTLLSAPDRAPGCPKLRPAAANQPLGPR
eukprot:scaffold108915_cov60-Phaeocystis_antarctica.AAC.2